MKWNPKQEWNSQTDKFNVVVSKHLGYKDENNGGNRWCIYAYIYPTHSLFDELSTCNNIFDDPIAQLPLHCGCSVIRKHYKNNGNITSIQIGCDYNHLYDTDYTFMETEEDAYCVFKDAEKLYEYLSKG